MENETQLSAKEMQEKLDKMRRDWLFQDQLRKISNFTELNLNVEKGNIVFAGDSITEIFPLNELFKHSLPLYNRGISGFTSRQLLQNINTQILDLEPSKVFLLIGTNDIAFGIQESETIKNILDICRKVEELLPETIINVISIFPVNETTPYSVSVGNRNNARMMDINQQVKENCSTLKNTKFINLYDTLLDDNQLCKEYTHDGLHLSAKGYKVVSNNLKQYLI